MKRCGAFLLVMLLSLPFAPPAAGASHEQWKAIEVKHTTAKPGLDMTQEDLDYFYQGVLIRLRFHKVFTKMPAEQILEDGVSVSADDAANSILMESSITSLVQGGHGTKGSLQVEFRLYRMSDHQLIFTYPDSWIGSFGHKPLHGKDWHNVGFFNTDDLLKAAQSLPSLASFPAAAPPAAAAAAPATTAAAPLPPANVEALTNQSIVEMAAAKLPDEVIIAKIQVSPNSFDLSTPALAELNQKGVSAAVLKAMIVAPRTGAPVQPANTAAAGGPGGVVVSQRPGTYKTVEVKHLTAAAGAQPSPALLEALYQNLKTKLDEDLIGIQVVGDDGAVAEADAANSVVVEGKITSYRKAHLFPPVLGEIGWQMSIYRRSDHSLITTVAPPSLKLPLVSDEVIAKQVGEQAANDVMKALNGK